MQKQLGAIFLVAGTTIGSGMIALPMVLAPLGIIPSFLLLLMIWGVVYHSALVNVELNLQTGQGSNLSSLGRHYSGPLASTLGLMSFKLLTYALLSVYIYGGTSILQKLLFNLTGKDYSTPLITTLYTLAVMLILLSSVRRIDHINRILFTGLLVVVAILIIGLSTSINFNHLPLTTPKVSSIFSWRQALPVVFTSFGFHIIFQALVRYCHMNKDMLKKAFFWGSLIPTVIYFFWTTSVLSIIYHSNPGFYAKLLENKVDVGDMIQQLSLISQWPAIQALSWWISILAILTSVIGVGLGLTHSWMHQLEHLAPRLTCKHMASVVLTILPAYLLALLVPNAFISILGFAGLILVIIAIFLPYYLFYKGRFQSFFYPLLSVKSLMIITIIIGLIITLSEIMNIFAR
jgi:tyrosine-specific transport protein